MAIDFDSFWRAFHVVFLDLESSTFDPAESNMINICPAELFYDFIKQFAIIVGIVLLIPVGLSIIFTFFGKKSAKRKEDFTFLDIVVVLSFSFALVSMLANWLTGLSVFRWLFPLGLIVGGILTIIRAKFGAPPVNARAENC